MYGSLDVFQNFEGKKVRIDLYNDMTPIENWINFKPKNLSAVKLLQVEAQITKMQRNKVKGIYIYYI